MAIVFPFGEGSTDRIVFDFLQSEIFPGEDIRQFVPVNGKDNFRSRIQLTVRGEILPNNGISVLVFRDLDAGEQPEIIAEAFRSGFAL